jgi:hypothetical protein
MRGVVVVMATEQVVELLIDDPRTDGGENRRSAARYLICLFG